MLRRLIKVILLFSIIYTDKKFKTEFDIMKPKSKWKNCSYHMQEILCTYFYPEDSDENNLKYVSLN